LRIAVLATADRNWFGGVQYIQNILWSFQHAGLVGDGRLLTSVTLIANPDFLDLAPDELLKQPWLRVLLQPSPRTRFGRWFGRLWLLARVFRCDVVYPCPYRLGLVLGKRGIGWIPDFQHVHLPQFFSAKELENRNRVFRRTLSRNGTVVLSSHDARACAESFLPDHRACLEVVPFHVLPERFPLRRQPIQDLLQSYGVPSRYMLCANQFWEHKDHRTLFRALALAAKRCPDIHLVCTGRLMDSRDPDFLETLLREASSLGILKHLSLLGFLPRLDQITLMKVALVVVQPSLYEGWSTVVEDARAFGVPLILSNLDVHREQAPKGSIFFSKGNSDDLAERLVDAWSREWPERKSDAELQKDAESRLLRMGQELGVVIRKARRKQEWPPSI